MIDVVYIDDEAALLKAISTILRRAGLSVATFADANEAVRFVNQNEVGLVLCDYRMPAMNGLEVARALHTSAPLYLISGELDLDPKSIESSGVAGVFCKPLNFKTLVATLNRALGRPD